MSEFIASVPSGPVIAAAVAVEGAAFAVAAHRRGAVTTARLVTCVAIMAYTAAFLSLTLFPLQIATGRYANHSSWLDKVNFFPVVTIDGRTFALNVLLTVPVGVLLPLLRPRVSWRTAVAVGFVLSFCVESAQALTNVFLSSGRTGDVNDLIANTVGALLGFLMVRPFARTRLASRLTLWSAGRHGSDPPRHERGSLG